MSRRAKEIEEMLDVLAIAMGAAAVAGIAGGYYATYAVRSQVLGETIWRGKADTNSVALTFDDGPSEDTESILDVLKAYGVKAAFFMIGTQVEKFPEVARRVALEGHEIGNHSLSHPIFLYHRRYAKARPPAVRRAHPGIFRCRETVGFENSTMERCRF
jgi:peptidoglycan/xylan/chitin deacetylase (PgdA/CDA1 family)